MKLKKLFNEKYGIEINIDTENIKDNYIPFEVKESSRSKKLKYKYGSSFQKIEAYFNRLVQFEIDQEERKTKRKIEQKNQKEELLKKA